ncbi:rhomboid family protein [Halorubrum aidingense JCM 13560]|uniref:Rhomboid family protein n=1 Tax=Halorubrum aidingense JCM 13560 TaxID=1230454 RepID=M0PHJ1_9EURY|nr:rhomboid family intramembrane serine protease [Halorubrum aidingense]EMA68255.1 rhomboid family protein [Halorubrum aidingense JCM 13560]
MIADAVTADAVHLAVGGMLVAVALAVVYLIDRPDGAWTRSLRSRLLLGVPWGTLVVVAVVVAVYLFVQRGIENPNRPVVIPFRSWSYFYPEGMFWSGFAHSSRGHITGNLLSTLVAGTLAEYAYGHFPDGRNVDDETGTVRSHLPASDWREAIGDAVPDRDALRASLTAGRAVSNPYVRAFLVVPGAMLLFGFVSSLFALGPVIGFSGVVFALWGFALIHYPIGTVAALTGATLANVVYETLRSPVVTATASGSYGAPSWANIAVQGHAIGLISGVIAAVWVVRRRRRRRRRRSLSATRERTETAALAAFGAILLFGASRRLWAVYWYLGNEQYELYRALGVGLLALLAALVALAVAGREEPFWPTRAVRRPATLREGVRSATPAAVGLLLLVSALAVVAGPGIVPNLTTVNDGDLPGDPIEVNGYQVTYAENVEDQTVSVVDVEAFGRSTVVNTSGVIVSNPDREIWTTAVSRGNLAFWGYRAIDVGGTGWRETVWVQRTGWETTNGGTAYRVDGIRDETRSTLFTSEPARAEPRVDGRNVTVAAVDAGFELRVEHDGTNQTGALPGTNESVTLQGVSFVRENDRVVAERGETRVQIAQRERYEGRQ